MSGCFELFRDKSGKYRWRLKDENEAVIADALNRG